MIRGRLCGVDGFLTGAGLPSGVTLPGSPEGSSPVTIISGSGCAPGLSGVTGATGFDVPGFSAGGSGGVPDELPAFRG